MDTTSQKQSTTVTSQNQSNPDRSSQLAAARQRALEVRKQRAEERKELKKQEKESEKLRLQKVKLENEKLRKELQQGDKGEKKDESPKKPEKEEPKAQEPPKETQQPAEPTQSKPVDKSDVAEEQAGVDNGPDPMTYMAHRIDHLTSMFEEEMNYKKRKREAQEKEAKRIAEANKNRHSALRADPTYTAYMNTTKKNVDTTLMNHIFG